MNDEKKYVLVKFVDGGFEIKVKVSLKEEAIWMTLAQILVLFGRHKSVILRHIKKISIEKLCN